MKLIIGLGNPGKEYDGTRHNIGFEIIDRIADKHSSTFSKMNNGVFSKISMANGEKLIIAKPTTFMNLSGNFVNEIASYYKISLDDIMIVHDEKSFPIADSKLKFDGGSAGHNGIKDITLKMSSSEYIRLRVGIETDSNNLSGHVLGKFKKDEQQKLDDNMSKYINIIEDYSELTNLELMNKYN
ncbi:MAG: aminoacyl-tRNA hydrolase [Tenericutes bacterium]|nr:MAG: aminoacyl-tRNA hydrolase [Mycoplasmatota bacterium]